ncbi:hypothetical protein KP509_19G051400 [Ceratopteris richardii]|nr:hypothetical protein KP509_19G051400 [Ceratopteris richardii]KAH7352548.1 hypothetical protein KP509_19G051400 [Ceratopteris richardii]KAH7352550.1 hypothetical protein KP509_19G051400 [Ceratopteris richardii]
MEKPVRVKGTEVFVGGLPQSTTEETLKEVFSEFGEVCEMRLMKDQNGNLKGYAFLRFTTKEAASMAQKKKHGAMLNGKKIRVSLSTDHDRLFIGSLKKEWTQEEVEEMIKQAFEDVVDFELAVVPDVEGTSNDKKKINRGFGFITFKDHPAAARAYRIGNKPDFTLKGKWHPIIDWAQSETDFDPDEMAKITVAFVSNLPNNVTEDFLSEIFEPFGEIEKIALSRKEDYTVGFVHFTNRSDLDSAIKELNGKTVKGPDKKQSLKLQVAVSRPLDKSKKRNREEYESAAMKVGGQKKLDTAIQFPVPVTGVLPRSIVDPYELKVGGLDPVVTGRLLQIFQRGIINQHEVGINVIEGLRDLPPTSAIEVLDKFATANFKEIRNRIGYLATMIKRSNNSRKGSKVGAHEETGRSLPLPNGHMSGAPSLNTYLDGYNLTARISDSELLGYSGIGNLSTVSLTSGLTDPMLSRGHTAFGDALSLPAYQSSLTALGLGGLSTGSLGGLSGLSNMYGSLGSLQATPGGHESSAPDRKAFRFDPYTGEPFKFDPFTGEPLQHSGVTPKVRK